MVLKRGTCLFPKIVKLSDGTFPLTPRARLVPLHGVLTVLRTSPSWRHIQFSVYAVSASVCLLLLSFSGRYTPCGQGSHP